MRLVVFEDSSKVGFGGGQRVTMQVLRAVEKIFTKIDIYDFTDSSRFFKMMEVERHSIELLCKRGSSRFLLIIKLVFLSLIKKNLPQKNQCVLYATTKLGLIICWLLNLIWGYRFIYHCHLVERHAKILQILYGRAATVIFVCRLAMGNYKNPNGIIIYNGIDPISYPKPIRVGRMVVAYIGAITEKKGVFDFLKAVEIIGNDLADFRVYGAGAEVDERHVLALADTVGVKFEGFCEQVVNLISQEVDIVVYPSKLIEAFPMVVLEAVACGKYILTTTYGGQVELISMLETPVIEMGTPEAIAKALRQLLPGVPREKGDAYQKQAMEVMHGFSARQFERNIKRAFLDSL